MIYVTFFKTIYEKDFDEDAFVLSRAADILRKSLLERELKEFDGKFHLDSQSSFVPQVLSSFVDMILQGTSINKNKKYLEQANLTISQLFLQSKRVASRSLLKNDGTCQNSKKRSRR